MVLSNLLPLHEAERCGFLNPFERVIVREYTTRKEEAQNGDYSAATTSILEWEPAQTKPGINHTKTTDQQMNLNDGVQSASTRTTGNENGTKEAAGTMHIMTRQCGERFKRPSHSCIPRFVSVGG